MKKTLKILVLVVTMLLVVLALTGCGNKLVATKENEANETTPKYKEELEMTFKNDKINKVKMTCTFETNEDAKKFVDDYNSILALYKALAEDSDDFNLPELKQSGKKAVMEVDAETYEKLSDGEGNTNMTKEEVKKQLEEQGYTVK